MFDSKSPNCVASPMDNEAMEQYADWLDNMEKTDPEGYKQLIATMQSELLAAGVESKDVSSAQQGDTNTALLDLLKSSDSRGQGRDAMEDFKPRFPGDKVMEENGLKAVQEGMYIDVTPGFVMKTVDVKNQKKVFVNVVFADEIQAFSEKKKLNDKGEELEGIHVPLSLGAPHEVKDKMGRTSVAFDVAVNTKVVEDCAADKTGAFRNFVCELAIEYIDQKYQIKLDSRYKLPRLTYRGDLPPPKHYIRKKQAPRIQEVTKDLAKKTLSSSSNIQKQSKAPNVAKTATARCTIYEERQDQRTFCERLPSIMKGSTPLSPDVLQQAGVRLIICIQFEKKVRAASDIELELQAELVSVKATAHHDLEVFLPYPVQVNTPRVCLDLDHNALEMIIEIDKRWDTEGPDCGSAPWLLAQALDGSEKTDSQSFEKQASASTEKPKTLGELFHLVHSDSSSAVDERVAEAARRWDPVLDEEELPEDRFHRKDMMSMHILEQRRMEREQKAKEAEAKRMHRRAEVEEKQKKAQQAGKAWHEMYPDEPETTYIDVENIVRQEKAKLEQHQPQQMQEEEEHFNNECIATEDARRRAAQWSKNTKHSKLKLQSALAFDLL